MSAIHLLDASTIDKIAAGEVVERPASVIKELIENAIDAHAAIIRVEIEDGGTVMMRVTDNGDGIEPDSVPTAFLRHATSKISDADDLLKLTSLGFRGEALASIAAVSKVEMVSKAKDEPYACAYRIEGGREISCTRTGAPDGTTITVRQLFYNVPVRRKFLKTPVSEAVRVHEVVTELALSHPDISFTFVTNGQVKLTTSGNGRVLDTITRIYGVPFGREMLEVDSDSDDLKLTGYIGSPALSRGNRGFETLFINGRYVVPDIASKALEEAYRGYTMQHRFPVCVLYLQMRPDLVDMNIHPAKSKVRLADRQAVYDLVYSACRGVLSQQGRVPVVTLNDPPKPAADPVPAPSGRKEDPEKEKLNYFMNQMRERVAAWHNEPLPEKEDEERETARQIVREQESADRQISLFENETQIDRTEKRYQLIGQLFDTYWLVESDETFYIIDQHAAHEKVLFDQTMKRLKDKQFTSQSVSPPIILNVTAREEQVLKERMSELEMIGFRIEPFGEQTYAVTGVPDNLYTIAQEKLLREMIDEAAAGNMSPAHSEAVLEKVASLSCKAAIKGNTVMDAGQMNELLKKLFASENPYHCPHGRPTMIAFTHRELDKKFKRIV